MLSKTIFEDPQGCFLSCVGSVNGLSFWIGMSSSWNIVECLSDWGVMSSSWKRVERSCWLAMLSFIDKFEKSSS